MKPENIKAAMDQAKASLAIEGKTISLEQEKLIAAKLAGEISEQQFKETIDRLILGKK